VNPKIVVTVAVVLLAAVGVVLWRKRSEKHRFIAIAVLTPPNTDLAFTPATLTAAAERAWSYKFPTGAGATDWVVGEAPILMVKAAGFHFIVNCHQRNYFTMSPPGQAPPVPPAWAPPHAGWFSVDLMATDSPRSDEEIYSRAGALVSALMADDTVALFLPDQGILVSLDTPSIRAQTRDALKSSTVVASLTKLGRRPA
jgi:hypothetical protein